MARHDFQLASVAALVVSWLASVRSAVVIASPRELDRAVAEECFTHDFTWSTCCNRALGPHGHPQCWQGGHTYERCCVAAEAPLFTFSVAKESYAFDLSSPVRIAEEKGHGKAGNPMCWQPPFTYDVCCGEQYGPNGNAACWDQWNTPSRCCHSTWAQVPVLYATGAAGSGIDPATCAAKWLEQRHAFRRASSLIVLSDIGTRLEAENGNHRLCHGLGGGLVMVQMQWLPPDAPDWIVNHFAACMPRPSCQDTSLALALLAAEFDPPTKPFQTVARSQLQVGLSFLDNYPPLTWQSVQLMLEKSPFLQVTALLLLLALPRAFWSIAACVVRWGRAPLEADIGEGARQADNFEGVLHWVRVLLSCVLISTNVLAGTRWRGVLSLPSGGGKPWWLRATVMGIGQGSTETSNWINVCFACLQGVLLGKKLLERPRARIDGQSAFPDPSFCGLFARHLTALVRAYSRQAPLLVWKIACMGYLVPLIPHDASSKVVFGHMWNLRVHDAAERWLRDGLLFDAFCSWDQRWVSGLSEITSPIAIFIALWKIRLIIQGALFLEDCSLWVACRVHAYVAQFALLLRGAVCLGVFVYFGQRVPSPMAMPRVRERQHLEVEELLGPALVTLLLNLPSDPFRASDDKGHSSEHGSKPLVVGRRQAVTSLLRTALAPSVTVLLVLRSDQWMFPFHRPRCTFALFFGLALRMLRLSPGPLSRPPDIVLFCARLSLGLNLLHELALFIVNGVMYNNAELQTTAAAALGNCCTVGLLTLALSFITDAVVAQPAVWFVGKLGALISGISTRVMRCCRRPPQAVASDGNGVAGLMAAAAAAPENAQAVLEDSSAQNKVAASERSPPQAKGIPSEESSRQVKGRQTRGKARADRAKQQS